MRKKLDTRFPASRIKKIMQADEDVGKIALAVPVLVSKALELFLQDLCDRTYSITLQRGVKTMSSLHLKQCVHSFNVFDFLRDIVSKVPDIGSTDAGGEDRSGKRRKTADEDDSEEESKRTRTEAAGPVSGTRGRGRGRGRGRRGARGAERDSSSYDKCEDDPGSSPQHNDRPFHLKTETAEESSSMRETKETIESNSSMRASVLNIDLNLDLDENGDASAAPDPSSAPAPSVPSVPAPAPSASSVPAPAPSVLSVPAPAPSAPSVPEANNEVKNEEYPGWSLSDMQKMAIDPVQFALSHQRLDEEEDYDNEEG
ncbi:uncharacterized protein [Typha latifolia]|uniref:uncharacterized protein n=1 Tax=Typha latifolia TaxID=4733 RepID=UPI003C2C78CA